MTHHRPIRAGLAALALALPVAACVPPESGTLVNAGQAQVAQNVTFGTVIGARTVNVQGTNPGGELAGTLGGAVLGGAIGNQIGDGEGRDIARAAGIIGGAVAGNAAANRATTVQSVEWTVRLDSGRTVAVIQRDPVFSTGQRVRVVQGRGGLTRILPA